MSYGSTYTNAPRRGILTMDKLRKLLDEFDLEIPSSQALQDDFHRFGFFSSCYAKPAPRVIAHPMLVTYTEVIDGVDWLPGPGYNGRKDWIIRVRKHVEARPDGRILYDDIHNVYYAHPARVDELRRELSKQ